LEKDALIEQELKNESESFGKKDMSQMQDNKKARRSQGYLQQSAERP